METYSMRFTEALSEFEDVQTIALRGQANGMPPGPTALLRFPLTVMLACFRRSKPPEILHLGDMAIWPFGVIALLWRDSKLFMTAHGTDVAYHRRGGVLGNIYGLYLRAGAALLGRRATIVANSNATKEITAETGWKRIAVVPLASDFVSAEGRGEVSRTILFAGRLVKRKGLSWFVREVLPLLPKTHSVEVAGTIWDDSEQRALSDPRVRYLGPLSQGELAKEFAKALCVIVPNIEPENGEFEGFGLVAPEAAAAGGVVLAANHGGLTDAVIHEQTGFLVQSENASKWASEIERIANWPPQYREDWCRVASAKSREYFSWKRVAEDTSAHYRDTAMGQLDPRPRSV
jgi:glycosyltransferase involved in cell wall biosynthesis